MTRETSIEAFNEVMRSGHVTERQRDVYRALYDIGPATARKLNASAGDGAWKRLSELSRLGLVEEAGETVCEQTRKRVIVWRVTANHPPTDRPKVNRRPGDGVKASLRAENAMLRKQVAHLTLKLSRWGRPKQAVREARATQAPTFGW